MGLLMGKFHQFLTSACITIMVGDYHFMSAFESALYAENQTGSCESCFPCKSEGKSVKCIQSPKKLYTFNIGTLTLIPYCPKI